MKAVYSPCVEPLEYMYDSKTKKLDPDTFTVLDDGEARYVVRKFARFGVRFLATKKGKGKKAGKPVVDEADVAEAKAVWAKGNKEWAEETLVDFSESTKAKREAGLKVEEPPQVKTAKKLLGVAVIVLALFLPAVCWAQADTGQHKAANFTYKYDVASDTITYCAIQGQQGDPFATAYDGAATIETVGSSTTVTTVGASGAFVAVDIGDVIFVRFQSGTVEQRIVVTNADDDTITVEDAIDLSAGYTWSYKKLLCGTTVDDGWISVAGYSLVQMGVQYDSGDVTALAATMECKGGALGAASNRVYPGISSDCGDGTLNGTVCEFTSVGDVLSFKMIGNAFSACRLGVAWVTAVGAGVDEITATIDVGR